MKTIVELQDSIKGITSSLQSISVELGEYGKTADNSPTVDFLKVDAIGKNNFFANCLRKRSIATFSSNAVAPHCIPFKTSCTCSFCAIKS